MDQRIRRVFKKHTVKFHVAFCVTSASGILFSCSLILILSQMKERFLKGYDIQDLPLWFISTYSLVHWVFQSENKALKQTLNSVYKIWGMLCTYLPRDLNIFAYKTEGYLESLPGLIVIHYTNCLLNQGKILRTY